MAKQSVQVYEFEVEGIGDFPTDMLRYDRAYPADTESAVAIVPPRFSSPRREKVTVRLHAMNVPAIDRWHSFLWNVVPGSIRKVG